MVDRNLKIVAVMAFVALVWWWLLGQWNTFAELYGLPGMVAVVIINVLAGGYLAQTLVVRE